MHISFIHLRNLEADTISFISQNTHYLRSARQTHTLSVYYLVKHLWQRSSGPFFRGNVLLTGLNNPKIKEACVRIQFLAPKQVQTPTFF